MSNNPEGRGFFADEYDANPRKVIKFIDEEQAGVFDVIPQRAKRPDALPAPEEYVPQHVEQWNPGKKRGKRLNFKFKFPPLRFIFSALALCLVGVLGWVFYTVYTVVLNAGL